MAEQKRRKPAANSRKPKSSAARSNRKPQKADPHMPGVVIMLLGLLLLLWFIVVYVQVIAMSQGFQGFCRSLLAAVGNLLLALMVVYAGSALYTQRKPKIGSWQMAGWCFVAFGVLALLQLGVMQATFGASLKAALKGAGGGPLGFWFGWLASLLPSEIAAAVVLWAFVLLGLLLGTDFKILRLFRLFPKAFHLASGMIYHISQRAKERPRETAKEKTAKSGPPLENQVDQFGEKSASGGGVAPLGGTAYASSFDPVGRVDAGAPEGGELDLAPVVVHYTDRNLPSELPEDLSGITIGEAQEIARAREGEDSTFIRNTMPTIGDGTEKAKPYLKPLPQQDPFEETEELPVYPHPDVVFDPRAEQQEGQGGIAANALDGRETAAGTAAATVGGVTGGATVRKVPPKPYQLPPVTLLKRHVSVVDGRADSSIRDNSLLLEQTLESFGVKAKVVQVVSGPAVTRYELQPAPGVRVAKIANLSDDIALALAAKGVRIEAPVPGKSVVGIEVPKSEVSAVMFREVVETDDFQRSQSKLSVALGLDIAGNPVVADLAKMPHLLVAGATGSGKSVCINGLISSILYKAKPDEVKMIMVDPKKVELSSYAGLPHLARPVVTNPRKAAQVLKEMVSEMERRYTLFSTCSMKNFTQYNESGPPEKLPQIIIIIDELADLMMVAAKEVEDSICRLAQMARAAGIHMVLATQRPSVDVITGLIKANIPSRIAFAVSSYVDSRTILDTGGAEKLLGRGDMLFLPVGLNKPLRVQGAYISEEETESLVNWCSRQAEQEFIDLPEVEEEEEAGGGMEEMDELFHDAVQQVITSGQASASFLQRRFRIGYNRAARLIETMEQLGIVGPPEGNKRPVRMTMEEFTLLHGHGK